MSGVKGQKHKHPRTHCKRGHEFSLENTRITPEGSRSCRTCAASLVKQWRKDNPEKEKLKQRRYWDKNPDKLRLKMQRQRLKRYGLTLEDYTVLLLIQDYKCLICSTSTPGGKGDWHVDHDHRCCSGNRSCGKCVRGLLCSGCNVGLGAFKDNPELLRKAATHIEDFSEVSVGTT